MDFKATEEAFARIAVLIDKENNHQTTDRKIALRISVDGGGCSGFMYNYLLIDKINNDDFILENNGTKIVIDPLSMKFLNNSRLEFIEELGAAYFQISNPAATAKCGCGNSFNI